jgi:hypothetical protein
MRVLLSKYELCGVIGKVCEGLVAIAVVVGGACR